MISYLVHNSIRELIFVYGDYKELSNNFNTEWTTKEMHVLHPTAGLFQLGHSLVTVSVMCIEGMYRGVELRPFIHEGHTYSVACWTQNTVKQ